MIPFQTHELLDSDAVSHGFFGRQGGVSIGQYASLNAGHGSDDTTANVTENRRRIAAALGTSRAQLQSLHQIHSRDVVIIDAPTSERPKADGFVTTTRGLAISAMSADCGPVLLADINAGVIGACHAGWRGAVAGITDATIEAMESMGASRGTITAVLGPCINQAHYEVGHDFRDDIIAMDDSFDRFFRAGPRQPNGQQKPHFDLKGFILAKLRAAGLSRIDILPDCTYGQPEDYFSYRYNCHNGINDYGRNISAIMLR